MTEMQNNPANAKAYLEELGWFDPETGNLESEEPGVIFAEGDATILLHGEFEIEQIMALGTYLERFRKE